MKTVKLSDKVFAFTQEKALFSAPCHVLVAVSGGPDSMALLHTLLHWPMSNLLVSAVHMNHGLRGETAKRDEEFVRRTCSEWCVPLTVFHENVAEYAAQENLTLEEAGRVLRYDRFDSLRRSVCADYLLTAHTASDQAETLLMHLARGCGLDALCGIPAQRDRIRRPMLSCTREEVLSYCQEYAVPFVTDETNDDPRFTRNRIRHQVLPALESVNPSVTTALLRFHEHISGDIAYLNELAETLLNEATTESGVQITLLQEASLPIRRRAIRMLLRQHKLKTIEESHIVSVEHILLSGTGEVRLPQEHTARVKNGVLFIIDTDALVYNDKIHLEITDFPTTFETCEHTFTLKEMHRADFENVHNLFLNAAMDYDTIQGALTVRTRRVGDTLRPAGRGMTKSLKKLMNEWKIPTELRDYFPLLCDDAGVLLVPGYGCDQRATITEQTQCCLVVETSEHFANTER